MMMAMELLAAKVSNTTYDLLGFFQLKSKGLQLLEVMVSPVSSLRGKLLSALNLPKSCRVMCLVRNHETFVSCEEIFLRAGDKLFVLADGHHEEAVKRSFLF
jgi:Trk K+ transport system NAD-binding subunit